MRVAEDQVRRRDPQPPRRLLDRREAGDPQVVEADLRLDRAEPARLTASAPTGTARRAVTAQPPAAAAGGQPAPGADGRRLPITARPSPPRSRARLAERVDRRRIAS